MKNLERTDFKNKKASEYYKCCDNDSRDHFYDFWNGMTFADGNISEKLIKDIVYGYKEWLNTAPTENYIDYIKEKIKYWDIPIKDLGDF